MDEQPGNETSDDQRTGGNTNDLRGKILRIHPEADGSYSIPEGNLFPGDCFSCHKLQETSIGPSYQAVAEKYKNDPKSYPLLASRIMNGSVGVWGEQNSVIVQAYYFVFFPGTLTLFLSHYFSLLLIILLRKTFQNRLLPSV